MGNVKAQQPEVIVIDDPGEISEPVTVNVSASAVGEDFAILVRGNKPYRARSIREAPSPDIRRSARARVVEERLPRTAPQLRMRP